MDRPIDAWLVPDAAIWAMVSNVRSHTTGVPIEKEAGPMMVMHWFGLSWWRHRDFKNAYQCIFEDDFVTARCGLSSVEAIGETRFILSEREAGHSHSREDESEHCEKFSAP